MADEVTDLIERSPFRLNFFAEGINIARAIGGSILCAHVAKTPWLQVLELRGSTLTHFGCMQLAAALEQHPSLTHLGLARNGVDTSALGALLKALRLAPLRHLDLEWNGLDNAAAVNLAELLASPDCALQTLSLERNDIRGPGCVAIATALQTNKTLFNLNLAFNHSGNSGAAALASMLKVNKTLLTLNLNSNEISMDGGRALADTLPLNNALVSLNLQGNHCVAALSERRENFSFSESFLELNLQDNKINATSIGEDLGHVLQGSRKVQAITFSGSGAGDAAFAPVLMGMSFMTALTSVDVTACGIGKACFPLLGDVLRSCASLHTLMCDRNRLDAAGAKFLAAGLARSTSITYLSINDCHVAEGVRDIADSLSKKSGVPLRALHLSGNDIDSDGLTTLVQSFTSQGQVDASGQGGLIELDLSRNRISSRAAPSIARILAAHRGLITVNLRDNHIADQLRATYIDLDTVNRYLYSEGSTDNTEGSVPAATHALRETPALQLTAGGDDSGRVVAKSVKRAPPTDEEGSAKASALVGRRDMSPARASQSTPIVTMKTSPVRSRPVAVGSPSRSKATAEYSSVAIKEEDSRVTPGGPHIRGMADIAPMPFADRRVQLHDYEANISDICISENQLRLKFTEWVSGAADPRYLAVSEFVRRYMAELVVPLPGEQQRVLAAARKYAVGGNRRGGGGASRAAAATEGGGSGEHIDFAAFSVLMLQLASH